MKNTTTVNAAPAAYETAFLRAQELLAHLEDHLEDHARRFAADKTNWGYVGDLNHLIETLSDLEGAR